MNLLVTDTRPRTDEQTDVVFT